MEHKGDILKSLTLFSMRQESFKLQKKNQMVNATRSLYFSKYFEVIRQLCVRENHTFRSQISFMSSYSK